MEPQLTQGPVCGVENCRSRLYEEGEDGYLYCQNGHRQGGLIRGQDDEDLFSQVSRTTTRKKKDDTGKQKVAKHLSGRSGVDLYLKCLQLILRHQIWYLIKGEGLTAELETVVFDLWSLRVAQLGDRIENDNPGFDSQSQSQTFSTLDSDESGTEAEKSKARSKRRKRIQLDDLPSLLDCLALCYLGILTLRLPVTPGDIHTWVTDGKLAYQRAIKYLPLMMKDRLPSTYHAALDPDAVLQYSRFYTVTTDLQIIFMEQHKIVWPPLNHPLILFRYLKELGLPLELYDATLRLARFLDYDFTPHQSDKKRVGIQHLPEAQLVGCLVVCTKLLYPFDNEQRHPRLPSEPTAVVLDWDDWARQIRAAKDRQRGGTNRFSGEELAHLQEKDILSMQPDQLDQYLDFYANLFLENAEIQRAKDTNDFRNHLYQMFPTEDEQGTGRLSDNSSPEDALKMVQGVHNNFTRVKAVRDAGAGKRILRPGQLYQSYKTEQDLSDRARSFYKEAAGLAGLSLEMLVTTVISTESRAEKWGRKYKKEIMAGK